MNSRPTPKAFGAALLPQVINCESWVFLSLQVTLGFSRFSQSAKFFLGDDLKRIAESLRCRSMTARMLCKPRIEIERRTDVVSARRTAKNIDPRHLKKYQGGELNSRPRAYESPALPLSYPGNSRQSWLAQAHVSTERGACRFRRVRVTPSTWKYRARDLFRCRALPP